MTFSKDHCAFEHPGAFAGASDHVRSVSEEDQGATSADLEEETKSKPSTPYTNPTWLKDIRSNYKKLVVSKCSQQTRQAVASNEKIKVASLLSRLIIFVGTTYFTCQGSQEEEVHQ